VQANTSRQATDDLFEEHEQLMESLTNATNASSSTLETARHQQTITDDLLAAVNESRKLADDASSNAERTLAMAEQTLHTLQGEPTR